MKRLQVLISAPGSSHGKTIFSLLLLAWARKQGLNPRAFKAGPDFIDPQYLAAVSGQAAPSLDPWFLQPAALRRHYAQWSADARLTVIEGVMGLYDGKRGEPFGAFSSASVSLSLGLPVLLVLNARKAGPTLATQVLGLQKANPRIRIAGVILNQAVSGKTLELLAPAIKKLCKLPVFGWLPSLPALALPERHLGLAAPVELTAWQAALEGALPEVEKTVNFAAILKALAPYAQKKTPKARPSAKPPVVKRFVLAVAKDEAFHFYYPEGLALLQSLGAEISFFSPLRDAHLPSGAQGLLIGGGFPELFGPALAANAPLREQVKKAIAAGLPTWAECGGLMWLAQTLVDLDGKTHAMVGALAAQTRMTKRLQHFGYATATATKGHAFLAKGVQLRGHEFHHSQWEAASAPPSTWILSQTGRAGRAEGWRLPRGLATYFHSYLPAAPETARCFAGLCQAYEGLA